MDSRSRVGLGNLLSKLQKRGPLRVTDQIRAYLFSMLFGRTTRVGFVFVHLGFPRSSAGKESTCNAVDPSLILGSGRSPGEGLGYPIQCSWASPVAQMVKNPPGDLSSISGLGRFPGGVHGNPLQYSCLENPMDKGAWKATVYGVTKSQT